MRWFSILTLLALSGATTAAAQGIVVPVRCPGGCAARVLKLDSVKVWANLERGHATTFVDHVIRNETADTVEGAFFFPIPAGAEVERVSLRAGQELELYNEWTRPEESRFILDGLARERPRAGLAAYAGQRLVHVRIPPVPPHGVKHLQLSLVQPLRSEGGRIAYRYPLAVGAAASPIGHVDLGMTIKTEAGFRDVRSPSHAVRVQTGTEPGRCPPRAACGTMSVPSHRVTVVRLEHAPNVRARDFELVYTPEIGRTRDAELP